MKRTKNRQGFSLVEISIATLVGAIVLACVTNLLVGGSKLMTSGMNAARGPEAAVLLMDRFEEDLIQVLQIPGDPRPPLSIEDGEEIYFYVPGADGVLSSPQTVVGTPRWWNLEAAPGYPGLYHPARDDEVLSGILIKDWTLTLWEPDSDENRPGWYLTIRVTFPPTSRLANPHVFSRLIYLPQPSANYAHYPLSGHEVNPGVVKLLPPPGGKWAPFDKIRPPGVKFEAHGLEDGPIAVETDSTDSFLGTEIPEEE